MGQCKDCVRYKADTKWCARLNRKRRPEGSCKEFEPLEDATPKTRGVPLVTLDGMVNWMRRRGVMALKHDEIAITLGTLEEPSPQIRPPKTTTDPEDEDARRIRERMERAITFYGTARAGSR